MHQNAFGGRAPPGPAEGAHSAPPLPRPLAVLKEGAGRGVRRGREGGKGGRKREGEKKGEDPQCPEVSRIALLLKNVILFERSPQQT